MPDHGERQAPLHRLCDSVSGANWRPTRFEDELTLSRYACCLCHVVPSMTAVLPCSHALCEQCLVGCAVVEDAGSVCPLDGEPFSEDECQRWQLPAKKKQNLRAHCWNEGDGCEFVGTMEDVLLHYETECAFHALQCPRCERRILRTDIAVHYVTGCVQSASCASSEQPNRQDSSSSSFNLSAMLDKLSTLQSQMNEVLESLRNSESPRSRDVSNAAGGFENSLECGLKVVEANICTMVTSQLNAGLEELKALIRDPCSDRLSTVQSQVNELVEQSRFHDASQFQEMARALRDSERELKGHVDRVEASLSSRLADPLRSIQRSIDSFQENFESSERERLLAVATSSDGRGSSSWWMEKRFILRKLESFATESTRTLELLRQQINRHDDKPWVSTVLGSHGGICRSLSSDESLFRLYIVLSNAEKIFRLNESQFAGWNGWGFSDIYIKLVFSVLRCPERVFRVHVDCMKMSENPRFSFTTVDLKALRSNALSIHEFRKDYQNECRACRKNNISHLCACFEVTKEKLGAHDFVRDEKLELRFSFY